MLDVLPTDIIHHITNYLKLSNIHNLVVIKNLYDKSFINTFNNNRIIHSNRIKLFLLTRYRYSLLFKEINNILNKHYYTMISKHTTKFPLFNNHCLLYAPTVPYDVCRFCSLQQSEHKYHKMIQMFLELVY